MAGAASQEVALFVEERETVGRMESVRTAMPGLSSIGRAAFFVADSLASKTSNKIPAPRACPLQ
jgi:hypothetical protein